MICPIRPPSCFACSQRRATRVVTIDGFECHMCDVCPTPEEIRERAALVRSKWDAVEYDCRRLGVSREHVDYAMQIRFDERICEMVYPPKVASY